MSGGGSFLDDAEQRARWGNFQWTDENARIAQEIIERYPPGRQHSASIPLLDLAQRQVGAETNTQGWLPVPVIEYVARAISVPYMRVYEVATFYTMFNKAPVGRFHVQVCGTTPCMLAGTDDVLAALRIAAEDFVRLCLVLDRPRERAPARAGLGFVGDFGCFGH
jgi:NADH-quinone oxidoreductase subunit E